VKVLNFFFWYVSQVFDIKPVFKD